ncbi:flippase-like domain-containing protein [Candidatus Pacearchaeota archaeon]|nr:flippase-like domain-containing protein [Candidatus Pacearchaeota archaeon]
MKKKSIKQLISAIILIAIIALFIFYIYKHISDFKTLFNVALSHIWLLIIVAIITLISLYLNGYLLDTLMKPFGLKLKFKESFGLAIITNFYNMITPFRGGMAARAIYLKKKHKFPYINFLAILSAIYVIIFLIAAIAGLLSMAFIWLYYGLFNLIIFLLFLAVFIFLLAIIIFSPKIKERKNIWLNRFIKVINGWHLIKNNKKVIFTTAIIAIIQLILGAIILIISYHIFGIEISFFKALFISSIGSLSILIAITPGNLGIGDAIFVFSAAIIGISLTEAIAATILSRAVGLIIIFILGPIFSYILLRNTNKK